MSRRIAALLIMGISFGVEGAHAQESNVDPAVEVTSQETRAEMIRQEQADAAGWTLVGSERVPGGQPPGTRATAARPIEAMR